MIGLQWHGNAPGAPLNAQRADPLRQRTQSLESRDQWGLVGMAGDGKEREGKGKEGKGITSNCSFSDMVKR